MTAALVSWMGLSVIESTCMISKSLIRGVRTTGDAMNDPVAAMAMRLQLNRMPILQRIQQTKDSDILYRSYLFLNIERRLPEKTSSQVK